VPFTTLLDPSDRTWLPPERLREVFASAGVALDAPVITTCGSGVTACVVALALHLLGHRDVAVYDGSWAEWGQDGHV
jgi:thiosulfate/3-mercaptopyruvate sulfurtransferase